MTRAVILEIPVQNPLVDRTQKYRKTTCVLFGTNLCVHCFAIFSLIKKFFKNRLPKSQTRRASAWLLGSRFSISILIREKIVKLWSQYFVLLPNRRKVLQGETQILTIWNWVCPRKFMGWFSVHKLSNNSPNITQPAFQIDIAQNKQNRCFDTIPLKV